MHEDFPSIIDKFGPTPIWERSKGEEVAPKTQVEREGTSTAAAQERENMLLLVLRVLWLCYCLGEG